MVTDLPVVGVWAQSSGTLWKLTAQLPAYSQMSVDARHGDVGTASFTAPYDVKAHAVDTDSIVTFDWRGVRLMSAFVSTLEQGQDSDGPETLTFSGVDALSILAWSLAYPRPAQPLDSQTPWDAGAAAPIVKPAESAVLQVVGDNTVARRGLGLGVPASSGRGAAVRIRPAFDNLGDLVLKKATRGGIGVKVGLVDRPGTSSQADLAMSVYVGADRSGRVRFSADIPGSIRSWKVTSNAPTVSRVIVSGEPGIYRARNRGTGNWVYLREAFVQGPQAFDNSELDEAADQALDEGDPTVGVEVEAVETANQQAWIHYLPGDTVGVKLPTGLDTTIPVVAVKVDVSDQGPTVTTSLGDPDGSDPGAALAGLILGARNDISALERRT